LHQRAQCPGLRSDACQGLAKTSEWPPQPMTNFASPNGTTSGQGSDRVFDPAQPSTQESQGLGLSPETVVGSIGSRAKGKAPPSGFQACLSRLLPVTSRRALLDHLLPPGQRGWPIWSSRFASVLDVPRPTKFNRRATASHVHIQVKANGTVSPHFNLRSRDTSLSRQPVRRPVRIRMPSSGSRASLGIG